MAGRGQRTPEQIARGAMISMIRDGELAELSALSARHPNIDVNALLERYGSEGVGAGSTGIPQASAYGASRDIMPPFVSTRDTGVGNYSVLSRDMGVGPDLPMADAFGDPTSVVSGGGGGSGGNEYMNFLKKVYNVVEVDRDNENPEDLQLVAAFQKKLGLVPKGLYKTPVLMRQAQQVNQFIGMSRNPCDDYLKF